MRLPFPRAGLALLLAGGLAACDVTPLRTMWALRNFDPLTTSPDAIRVAVRLPQSMRPDVSGMALTATLNATPTAPAERYRFAIEREPDARLPSWMRRAGAPLYGYKIADADLYAMRAFQAKAKAAKAMGRTGSLSFDAAVCRLSERMPETLPVSVFLKTDHVQQYVPLFVDEDLLAHKDARDAAQTAPPCT